MTKNAGYCQSLAIRESILGGWVNPHREQQTIPQGQTSIPPKYVSTPTANGQSAPRSGSARDVGRSAGSHTPSTASESFPHTHTAASMKRDRRKSLFSQRHCKKRNRCRVHSIRWVAGGQAKMPEGAPAARLAGDETRRWRSQSRRNASSSASSRSAPPVYTPYPPPV